MSVARFSSALSTRHDATLALREAAAELRDGLEGRPPDLLVVFVSPQHASEFDALAARLGSLTGARVLIGCGGESVIGRETEIERGPAISLWGVACEDLELQPFRLGAHPVEGWEAELEGTERIAYSGEPEFSELDTRAGSLLLFGDPYSFPMPDYLQKLGREFPSLAVTGGMASGATRPGESALFLSDKRLSSGAVGVHISGGLELTTVVSQAYRPVGEPWVVTACEGPLVKKLGGKPASKVMMRTLEQLSPKERSFLQNGAMLGVAMNAAQSDFGASDFLAHPIRGVAPQEDALVIVGEVRRGQTVQFLLRDPQAASEDLVRCLERSAGAPPAQPHEAGVLLFTCNGRGSRMFVESDHDVKRVHGQLGESVPLAGFFAMGEIGRVAGRNLLHGFTASVAVYRAQSGA
jgi:small ligand-binding sensory domain FIST